VSGAADEATHCVVIDTNVLAVAEGMHDGASDECKQACVALIHRVLNGQRVTVDSAGEILYEYSKTLQQAHTSGPATKLAKRLSATWRDPAACHAVEITPTEDGASYEEIPTALRDFDQDDQKFLAAAAATQETPPIFQALDGEWWRRRVDFAADGLSVVFLCATDLL
jgi:hypothetical protein